MRRVLVLVLVAAAVAVGAGLALPADAVKVAGASLTASQLNDELAAIDASPSFQCYLQAQAYQSTSGLKAAPGLPGTAQGTWNNEAAVQWTNVRTNQLAQVQYVLAHNPAAFSPANMAAARASLENEIYSTIYAAYNGQANPAIPFSCAPAQNGANTLASLPVWFVNEQVQAQAAYLGLRALLPTPVPESGPALEAWYSKHASDFDTACVALIAVSNIAEARVVKAEIDAGLSIASAARRWSTDPATRKNGGSIGCFTAKTQTWQIIQADIGTVPVGKVGIVYTKSGGVFLLGYTKKIPAAYASIAQYVAVAAHQRNIQAVQALAIVVLETAGVEVNPAVGVWVPSHVGGTLAAPPTPAAANMINAPANVPPTSPLAPTPSSSAP